MATRRAPAVAKTSPSRFKTGSPPLTRDEIVAAALRETAAGGLAQLTVRKLADELDVTPMALYRHVRDKDDILEEVTDALLAAAGLPDADVAWDEHLIALAGTLRAVLREHPTIVGVFTRRPIVTRTALARLAGAQLVLTRSGFSEAEARRMYAAVHTYTLGFCALEAARRATAPPTEVADPTEPAGELAAAVAGFVSEEQFELGLHALVHGLSPT